jgi:hypothetical protein
VNGFRINLKGEVKMANSNIASAANSLGRYQPKAIDLALESERNEARLRSEALREANIIGGHPNEVVDRAASYLAFLRGDAHP